MENPTNLLLGIITLLAGRKLFWLFVGIVGFAVGMEYGPILFPHVSSGNMILISLLIGVIGAALAIVAQWVVIMLAGFFGGGYFLASISHYFIFNPELSWIVFIIGGVIGAAIMVFAFDIALIVLSSLVGAALVLEAFAIKDTTTASAAFLVMVIVGVLFQGSFINSSNQ